MIWYLDDLSSNVQINKYNFKKITDSMKYLYLVANYDFEIADKMKQTQMAYERSRNWNKAEKDFLYALELFPDQPLVLNYLGYSWIDFKNKTVVPD